MVEFTKAYLLGVLGGVGMQKIDNIYTWSAVFLTVILVVSCAG